MTTVVVGDDHGVFVDALTTVLGQRRLEVLAVALRAAEVLGAVRTSRPDVCLLDRSFSDGDGIDLISDIRAASGHTKIIMVTADPDHESAHRTLELGASGFVHKTCGVAALLHAIDRVLAGQPIIELPPSRRAPRSAETDHARRVAAHLTSRERECLSLLVDGRSTPEMAARLGVSTATVRSYVQALMTKLGTHTRLEAVALCVRHDLVGTGRRSP